MACRFNIFISFTVSFFIILTSCNKNDENTPLPDNISVEITQPSNLETLTPGGSVEFIGKINTASNLEYSGLTAVWESDIDGLLYEGNFNDLGETKFSTDKLSQSIHSIKLSIRNGNSDEIEDQIRIYNALRLYPLEGNSNGATIAWSKAGATDFESYELYRSTNKNDLLTENSEPIYITNNIQDTTFIDTNAILGINFYYKAFIKRKTLAPEFVGSNIDSIIPGKFIDLDYPIYKVISDPNRNYVYGIVNVESIYQSNSTGYGLVFINTATQTAEKRIIQNVRFTDLAIDPTGTYLYLASRSTAIHKVNLNTRELETVKYVANPAHKIEVGNNNRLYYHITPPTSGSTQFRMYNLAQDNDVPYSTTISDAYSNFSHGDFELDETNVIFHGESNISSANLSKIGTTDDTFSLIDQYDSRDYQKDQIILKGNKLFWNHFLMDTELNPIGEFMDENEDINIQAVSADGEKALGWSRLFKTSDQSIIKKIPVFYETATFFGNDSLLLINNDNLISSKYTATVFFYDL